MSEIQAVLIVLLVTFMRAIYVCQIDLYAIAILRRELWRRNTRAELLEWDRLLNTLENNEWLRGLNLTKWTLRQFYPEIATLLRAKGEA